MSQINQSVAKSSDKTYIRFKELTNYLIIGILTTTVSLVTFYILVNTILVNKTDFDVQMANVLSWFCSVVFAYYTSRGFVFQSSKEGKEKTYEIFSFFASRVITLLSEVVLIYIMFNLFFFDEYACKIGSQALAIVMNYVLAKVMVFK